MPIITYTYRELDRRSRARASVIIVRLTIERHRRVVRDACDVHVSARVPAIPSERWRRLHAAPRNGHFLQCRAHLHIFRALPLQLAQRRAHASAGKPPGKDTRTVQAPALPALEQSDSRQTFMRRSDFGARRLPATVRGGHHGYRRYAALLWITSFHCQDMYSLRDGILSTYSVGTFTGRAARPDRLLSCRWYLTDTRLA